MLDAISQQEILRLAVGGYANQAPREEFNAQMNAMTVADRGKQACYQFNSQEGCTRTGCMFEQGSLPGANVNGRRDGGAPRCEYCKKLGHAAEVCRSK